MSVYLFIEDFLDRLVAAQYNPMVPANANLITSPYFRAHSRSLWAAYRGRLRSIPTKRVPFGPSILFSGLFLKIHSMAAASKDQKAAATDTGYG